MQQLCRLDEIPPGSARGFKVGGSSVIISRPSKDRVYAWLNRCPHLGVPLNWDEERFMDPEGSLLRCATHGALFEPDTGLCVLGPCRGDSLWQLDCELREDAVYIDPDELPSPASRPLA